MGAPSLAIFIYKGTKTDKKGKKILVINHVSLETQKKNKCHSWGDRLIFLYN